LPKITNVCGIFSSKKRQSWIMKHKHLWALRNKEALVVGLKTAIFPLEKEENSHQKGESPRLIL